MISFDQIYARTPYTELTGNEILLLQSSGVTGGSILSTLKSFFKNGFVANDVTDATALGKQVMTVADLASAKTLLEIPEPLAPVPLSTNTTLSAAHVNRKVFADTPAITLTLDATALLDTDELTIINISSGAIDIDAGASENIIVEGGGAPVTTHSLAANSVVKAYLVDADTWFFEV